MSAWTYGRDREHRDVRGWPLLRAPQRLGGRRRADTPSRTDPGVSRSRDLRRSSVEDRLAAYYRVDGNFAGALFLDVEPNPPNEIGAADLLAVSTLSIDLPARLVRRMLEPGDVQDIARRILRDLGSPLHPLTDLEPGMLDRMWDLQDTFRSVLATEEKQSKWWVFAAKLCARKRPELFPVRDSLVCAYLAAGEPWGRKPGQLGMFATDIQVFAHLISEERVRDRLDDLYRSLEQRYGVRPDRVLLRLWTLRSGPQRKNSRGRRLDLAGVLDL